jgi:NAD+ synthase
MKTPTADLEDDNPQQPDEDSLGVSYDQIDDFLEGKEVDPAAAATLERRYQITEHKRQGPVTIYCDWYK